VWQGMRALQSTMRDWVAAHDEMDRALFRSQTSMGLSISQAERYMATMRRMGGEVGLPAAQMAGGAMQLGPTAGMAGQFGTMTGMGGAEGMKFLAGIQKQYALSAEELEELIPRIWAAFAGSGEDIQTFLGHWQDMVNALGGGSDAAAKWARDWEIYETTGMRATERVHAAYQDFLGVLGDTEIIVKFKNAIADMFNVAVERMDFMQRSMEERQVLMQQYYEETGVQPHLRQLPEQFLQWVEQREPETTRPVPEMPAHEEWRLTGKLPGGGEGAIGTQFIDSVQIMTQAQYDQLEAATNRHEEMLTAQGIISSEIKEQIAINTEHGYKFDTLNTTALALLLANEEIRDMQRQMTGYFNWPGAQPSVMIGRPSQVEFPGREERQPDPNINITQPEPSSWIPWISGGPPYYQHGGIVPGQGPQPAIVHGGEQIIPRGQSPLGGSLKVQSDLYLDGERVSRSIMNIAGDKLLQAQRASMGATGALLSL